MLRSLIHLELGSRRVSDKGHTRQSSAFSCPGWLFVEGSVSPPRVIQPLWKLGWLWSCGLKCGPSVLLHWLMRLFLCRDHAVFVAIALQWGETRGGDALVLFCCSEWFGYPESFMAPYQFWDRFFSVSRKNSVGNWTGIALNLYLAFGRAAIFTTCIPPWAWAVSHPLAISSVFSSGSYWLCCASLSCPWIDLIQDSLF